MLSGSKIHILNNDELNTAAELVHQNAKSEVDTSVEEKNASQGPQICFQQPNGDSMILHDGAKVPKVSLTSVRSQRTASWMNLNPEMFQYPESTVSVDSGMAVKPPLKFFRRDLMTTAKGAIPIMPMAVAVPLAILNIIVPGLGTAISGFVVFYSKSASLKSDLTSQEKIQVMLINICVGASQCATTIFMLIGWFWSVAWSCAFIGFASKYGERDESGID